MALLSEQDQEHLRNEFAGLQQPVKLIVFTQEFECQYCRETRQIADEVAALSEKVSVEVYNFVTDKATADLYGVDKIPAIAVLREEDGEEADYGIRFYGIPSGYEFSSIIEDIIDVSKGDSGLQPKTKEVIASITEPVSVVGVVHATMASSPRL